MVLTRSQYENVSKEELIQELSDIYAVINSHYSRLETIELNPVPAEIHEDVLEDSISKALSLTGVNVIPEDLQACHRMKRSDRVIVKLNVASKNSHYRYTNADMKISLYALIHVKILP